MVRFLLLVVSICFISPLLYANEPQVCMVHSGQAVTEQQLGFCKKGDVLIIETLNYRDDVILAAKACVLGTVEIFSAEKPSLGQSWLPRSFCIYNGKPREARFPVGELR